jgi:hypothetical protein
MPDLGGSADNPQVKEAEIHLESRKTGIPSNQCYSRLAEFLMKSQVSAFLDQLR